MLVSVTVILASVVGIFVFDIGDLVGESAPAMTFSQEYEQGSGITLTLEAGEGVASEQLRVIGADPDGTVSFGAWPGSGPVKAGDSVTYSGADGDETFRVVWTNQDGDKSFVLAEWNLNLEGGAFQVQDGAVAFEGEAFSTARSGTVDGETHTWTEKSGNQASGGTYLVAEPVGGNDNAQDTTDGPRLDYQVDFQTAGTYYIWVRMQGPNGNDDSVHAGLNGSPASYGGLGMTVGSSGWQWEDEAGSARVKVTVGSPGVHTVNVWMREDGTPFDKVIVTDDPSYTPSGKSADGS